MSDTSVNYWNNYYSGALIATKPPISPSQFAAFCNLEMQALNFNHLVDIASGNGRDSLFFSEQGYNVIACDKSAEAFELLKNRTTNFRKLMFEKTDVVREKVPTFKGLSSKCGFFARFFLHTLSDNELSSFFINLNCAMNEGDLFFVEYSNEDDEFLNKNTPLHFRNFLSSKLVAQKALEINLTCLYEVHGRGFAKWKDDDAEVTRQVFRKSKDV